MCRSSLKMESTYFIESYYLLKGKKILNLHCSGSICGYSGNCCGQSSSNSHLCSRSHTHLTFFFFFLNPNHIPLLHITWMKTSHKQSSFSNLQAACPTAQVWPWALPSFVLCASGFALLGGTTLVCMFYSNQLAPACGSPAAGSHHLQGDWEYHFWGLKLGEGHGRLWVQSLLCKWHWLTVRLGKVIVPCSTLFSPSLKSGG